MALVAWYKKRLERLRPLVRPASIGVAGVKMEDRCHASAASNAESMMSFGVTGRWGDMDGVW